jgi:CPA2 family monovalent cation:H+ antiporter-2
VQEYTIIKDFVTILLVSVPIILLFHKIKLPSIAGFLIAGMLIGPFGFKLITRVEQIEIMAEIGVILLMFTIGLEVSLKELAKIKKLLLVGGGLQVTITILISAVILLVLGLPSNQAFFFGMLISLSSTAIVLRILSDRDELNAPHGKISLGILVFQDLSIVPMFLLIDIFGSTEGINLLSVITRLGVAVIVIAFILVAAKIAAPKLLYILARSRLRELFTIGILLILLGTAYLTYSFGMSFALGAFIAGLILSESEYSYQIISEILPFRDAFNSIFFVSVGLLLNISFAISAPLEIILLASGIILIKAVIIFFLVLFLKYPSRVAMLTAIGLAQIGEFSFILAQQGRSAGLLGEYGDLFLASTIFTMILTPLLIKLSAKYAGKTPQLELIYKKQKIESELNGHVVIAGFGLNGRNLARVLRETGIKYIVIEMNPDTVRMEKEKGENIIYGDISRDEVLINAGVSSANVLVVAISDPATSRRVIKTARKLNKELYVLIRTRFINETEELTKLGADAVIPEEFETSIQIFRMVLEQYHIPLNVIMQQINLLRGESYKWMRTEKTDPQIFSHLDEILAVGITDTFYVNNDNPNIGKTFGELDIRAVTGATIIAIVRKDKTISNPPATEKLLENDTLVITGTHKAVDNAFKLISG